MSKHYLLSGLLVSAIFLTGCQSQNVLDISGLSFELPNDWELQTIDKTGVSEIAKIQVPDSQYEVIVPMQVSNSNVSVTSSTLLSTTAQDAKIYENACAPALACYYLVYKGETFEVNFLTPESNEPVPKNLDGVWFPKTSVTKSELQEFVGTVK